MNPDKISADMKTKTEKLIVEVIAHDRGNDEVGAKLPASIIENADGRDIELKPVKDLAYKYDRSKFIAICQSYGLNSEECNRVKELIDLNSGYITWALLRSHLKRGSGLCMQLCKKLASAEQATEHPKDRPMYLLPAAKRSGFM